MSVEYTRFFMLLDLLRVKKSELETICEASAETVQEWYNGSMSVPQIKVEMISSYFNIPLEMLFIAEPFTREDKILIWESYLSNLFGESVEINMRAVQLQLEFD